VLHTMWLAQTGAHTKAPPQPQRRCSWWLCTLSRVWRRWFAYVSNRAPAWHTLHHLVALECRWTPLARWCGQRCLPAATTCCGGWRQQKTRHHQLVAHGSRRVCWQVEYCEMAGNGGCLCVLACGRQHPRLVLHRSPAPGAAGVPPGRWCWKATHTVVPVRPVLLCTLCWMGWLGL